MVLIVGATALTMATSVRSAAMTLRLCATEIWSDDLYLLRNVVSYLLVRFENVKRAWLHVDRIATSCCLPAVPSGHYLF